MNPVHTKHRGPGARVYHPAVAVAVGDSQNQKTGPVAATYVGQGSCPLSCPHLNNGCYAELGHVGLVTARLNDATGITAEQHAAAEAHQIDGLRGNRDMRLHVVGDCRTPEAARTVAAACERYIARSQELLVEPARVWTYTHAWAVVPRDAWGPVSVLASVETYGGVLRAHAQGYAAAVLVPEFDTHRAWKLDAEFSAVPCPQQTHKSVQCVDCRLCMDADGLYERKQAIAFRPIGARRNTVVKTLEVLNE